jgi:hypothetical protein
MKFATPSLRIRFLNNLINFNENWRQVSELGILSQIQHNVALCFDCIVI